MIHSTHELVVYVIMHKMCIFDRDAPVCMVGQKPHVALGKNDEVAK